MQGRNLTGSMLKDLSEEEIRLLGSLLSGKISGIPKPIEKIPKIILKNKEIISYLKESYEYFEINNLFYNQYKLPLGHGLKKEPDAVIMNNSDSSEEAKSSITIEQFLSDENCVLTHSSPIYLKLDEDVIIASISRDIYSIIYAGKLTERIQEIAIQEAVRQNYVINGSTPNFMAESYDVVTSSIKNDINSINLLYKTHLTEDILSFFREYIKGEEYVLSYYSPEILKKDYQVIKRSIEIDPQSIDYAIMSQMTKEQRKSIIDFIVDSPKEFRLTYGTHDYLKGNAQVCLKSLQTSLETIDNINWQKLTDEDIDKLIEELIRQNYVLSYNSPNTLKNNVKLALSSLKQDIDSYRYISPNIATDKEIVKYLIEQNSYSINDLYEKLFISDLKEDYIIEYLLEKMGMPKDSENEESTRHFERTKKLIQDMMSKPLSISNVKKLSKMIANKKWEKYRQENSSYYTNIFNRICDSLEKNNNFIAAIGELNFLMKVDDVLDERKYLLFNAFIEYHQIYHNYHGENKTQLLEAKRDEISTYSAIFIAKSKEDFIKEQEREYERLLKSQFELKQDNPIVRKKLIEIKQREMLKKLFQNNDLELLEKLDAIKRKYKEHKYYKKLGDKPLDNLLDLYIKTIITGDNFDIDNILLESRPPRFEEYEMYEKIKKIINRLNSKNISYDGPETEKYRNLIGFDGNKYVYKGLPFDEQEIEKIMVYKDLKNVFNKIKSEILKIAKSIENIDKISKEDVDALIEVCPFSDEYFKSKENLFEHISISCIVKLVDALSKSIETINDDDYYGMLYDLFVEQGVLELSLICLEGYIDTERKSDTIFKHLLDNYLNSDSLSDLIRKIPDISSMLGKEEFSMDNLDRVFEIKEIFKDASIKQISLLGSEVIKKICLRNEYTTDTKARRIKVACELVSKMVNRTKSTVPYINGEHGNYRYSMYAATDETILTSGIDTNACFRCCGPDNDFLHYCALDKNGFVMKLTDKEGRFIGRASGFRNGNGIYINQLRTIYDKKTTPYSSEKYAIIEAFKKACSDIVETSQQNDAEKDKIDFVVVTRSYIMEDELINVSEKTKNFIGSIPMETKSEDWQNFIQTSNLKESPTHNKFTTDYGYYSLICVKSAIGELTEDKIKRGDVPAVYERSRSKIEIKESIDEIEKLVNKIRALHSYQTEEKFKYYKPQKGSKLVCGDNWYIVFNDEGILDSCYLESDEQAKQEYETIMEQILKTEQRKTK